MYVCNYDFDSKTSEFEPYMGNINYIAKEDLRAEKAANAQWKKDQPTIVSIL